ncbi:unnamed protein product [Kluyveromyces dobzhanskii CBS 2104]|uniref:WGS project CCBQ000000000 data, contig 00102 n=1 Tax=Kluyveromyces dobzhanskii CBS 2104 TaxID=1427455 RepID=A0A0A8L533_9SACH|nr:unnamed protein product [Kluyveromyces dobzhanskii CBS 2104]
MNRETEVDKRLVLQLRQEVRIVCLLYHRNKNQHKTSVWWKQLNILKRNVAHVVPLLESLVYKGVRHDKDLLKIHSLLHAILKLQIKKMYYDFNGVISLGQFVTLGVVLVGALARIYKIYSSVYDSLASEFYRVGCVKKSVSGAQQLMLDKKVRTALEAIVDEEIGELIEEESSTQSSMASSKRSKENVNTTTTKASWTKEAKKSKKKKLKKKSAIDDLFG